MTEPSPARVVADADVLAADLLVGGPAREALDHLRAHSWTTLVASDALLDDAEGVISALTDDELAADWRDRVEETVETVGQPAGDHPALAAAYRGGAMHVLTFDDDLRSADAGAAIRDRVETSVKHPRAFARLFDPTSLYAAVDADAGDESDAAGDKADDQMGERGDADDTTEYPGPDRDPRG